jgi:hypothetical protein
LIIRQTGTLLPFIHVHDTARPSKNAECCQCNFGTPHCPDFCRFTALENLKDSKDINTAWENIQGNIKTSAQDRLGLYELKWHKPQCEEECLGFLDQWKKV